jgi:hypothetical protein
VIINYNCDGTGRVVSVTGENNLVENVSTYASNLAYRAWGALKDIDYGNGAHSHIGYNTRLFPTAYSYELPLKNAQQRAKKIKLILDFISR